jgi:hypothetical protein
MYGITRRAVGTADWSWGMRRRICRVLAEMRLAAAKCAAALLLIRSQPSHPNIMQLNTLCENVCNFAGFQVLDMQSAAYGCGERI